MRYQYKQLCQYVLALMFPFMLIGCDEPSVTSPSVRFVKTWAVTDALKTYSTSWVGTIEPTEEITLHFRMDGKLADRPVDVGSTVIKGEIVAKLGGTQSKENVAAALAEYQEAVAAANKGMLELERTKKLFTIGTVSRAQLEEVTASMAALKARKIRAEAQKLNALNESAFNILNAPFDGVVTLFSTVRGQSISAGQEVVRIASKSAEAQFSISPKASAQLKPGSEVYVVTDKQRVRAVIRYISPQLDSNTRARKVRATILDQNLGMILGDTVSVEVPTSDVSSFAIPASSLMRSGNDSSVFIVNPNSGKLETRKVTILRFTSEGVLISDGLKIGERVVTAGVATLENGQQVALMPEAGK